MLFPAEATGWASEAACLEDGGGCGAHSGCSLAGWGSHAFDRADKDAGVAVAEAEAVVVVVVVAASDIPCAHTARRSALYLAASTSRSASTAPAASAHLQQLHQS